MARIVYGGIASSIRGSIGGTTFQKNAFGYTAKNKPKMVLPLSPDQALSKLILRKVTTLWRTLTNSERAAWNLYASTYPQYSVHNPAVALSGYTLFCMWSFQYLLATFVENTPILEPVLDLPTTPVLAWSITKPSSAELILHSAFTPSSEDWSCNVFLTSAIPGSVNFVKSKYRFMVNIGSFITDIDITEAFLAKYGSLPPVGSRIGIRYVLFATFGGRVASPTFDIVTVS